MFESAEAGNRVDKAAYEAAVPQLRVDLVNAQYDLRDAPFSVVILIMGNDRIGCNEVIRMLHEWMDARFIEVHALTAPSDEALQRPPFWRYWRVLPAHGRIGVYYGAWALRAIMDRLEGVTDEAGFDRQLEHIESFERGLANNGTLLLKYWMHVPKAELKKRIRKAKNSPHRAAYIEDFDRQFLERYDEIMPLVETYLRHTDRGLARWQVVESTNRRYRSLAVAGSIRSALLEALARAAEKQEETARRPVAPVARPRGALDSVDLGAFLEPDEYREGLDRQRERLARLSRKARERGVSSVLVFEGWDAAGKGGVIRRVISAMAVRDYRIVPIAAPTEEERARHYLWRFWRELPPAGKMLIFDRSWYGRVLVERVEGLTPDEQWRRAYSEINDFEAQMVEHGMLVGKFWLHVDPEEQLRRFRARERTPYKKHKITNEDYRNRERWDDYVLAVNEMVDRTSTSAAPWHIIAANQKRWARVEVMRIICDGLEGRLKK